MMIIDRLEVSQGCDLMLTADCNRITVDKISKFASVLVKNIPGCPSVSITTVMYGKCADRRPLTGQSENPPQLDVLHCVLELPTANDVQSFKSHCDGFVAKEGAGSGLLACSWVPKQLVEQHVSQDVLAKHSGRIRGELSPLERFVGADPPSKKRNREPAAALTVPGDVDVQPPATSTTSMNCLVLLLPAQVTDAAVVDQVLNSLEEFTIAHSLPVLDAFLNVGRTRFFIKFISELIAFRCLHHYLTAYVDTVGASHKEIVNTRTLRLCDEAEFDIAARELLAVSANATTTS